MTALLGKQANTEGKQGGGLGGLGGGAGILGKFASKLQHQTQEYVLKASDNYIEDLSKECSTWKTQLSKDIIFREQSEQDNLIIIRENEKLRIRLEQQRSILNSKRRDPFKQQKITQTIEMIKRSRSAMELTMESQKSIREELLMIKASLVIQERIHAELTERMQRHIDDLEEKVSLEQKIVQCKESIERLHLQYEKLIKLMNKLKNGSTEQIKITTTLTNICNIMFLMHAYDRRTSRLDSNFLTTGLDLYKVLEESRKLISRNNLISDKLPYTLSPLKDEYMISIMDRFASLDLQVDDEDQVKFSKMSVAYIFRVFIVEVKIQKLIAFLEQQCDDYDAHQAMLRNEESKMLAIEYEQINEQQIVDAQKINDTIDEKMAYFNKIVAEYTVVVNVQRTGVDRFQEKIRIQCSAMAKERYRLNDILSLDGYQRVYKCVDTLNQFYIDVERVLKLKWLTHRYDYFINFRRQVMDLTSITNDLAANFHILRMTMDKFRKAINDIENSDIQRIDKLIRKLDIFMESCLKDHEGLIDIEKRVAAFNLQYEELKQIVCDEAETQVRKNIALRDSQARTVNNRDIDLEEYLAQKKLIYEGYKAEIDQEDIELYNKFIAYEGQIIEVTHDEEQAADQVMQIRQRIARLETQFNNITPVKMIDIDEVSDILDLLSTIGYHVQITEHLIEEAFKKIKEFEWALQEILKYLRNRRIANCDKAWNITFAQIDRLIKLIDRYGNDMKIIEDDQYKLINNGVQDAEKDRDTTQFKEEIQLRLDQLRGFGMTRDELKKLLEFYQQEFERYKNGDQNSSGIEFQKLQGENELLRNSIHKEIQKLEGQMYDDIQASKDSNVAMIHKYSFKIEKHQQGMSLRTQKQKDFTIWIEWLSTMMVRQQKLVMQLEALKFSPEHQQAYQQFNKRLLLNQDQVNEADKHLHTNTKIIQVEASDLDMLPMSIVKISKLEYIYDMLMKMKFLTDTFNDDIGNYDDALKQLEKEIADYLNKLRASQFQDCLDCLNRLDNSLEKLNFKINEVDGERVVFDQEFELVKDKLKNRESIQNAYNGLSSDHAGIKQLRDKFVMTIIQLKARFAKLDKDNVSVKDCEEIFAEGNQLDHEINDEYDKDVDVEERLRRLLMKLRNMNANEEERMRLVMLIRKLLGDNYGLFKIMIQCITASDGMSHDFERLYRSMIMSIDYVTRKAKNEKKLPKLFRIREENVRYTQLRNDAIAWCDKFTNEYLDDCYDIDELNEICSGLNKLFGDLTGWVKILTALVKTLERRRLKTQDAEVRKNANRHMKVHDEVDDLQNKCMRTIQSIEGAINATNAKDKAGIEKKEKALAQLQQFQLEFESFRPRFQQASKEIKSLYAEIQPKDLENSESVVNLAMYIDRLAQIGALLQELRGFISNLFGGLDELLTSLSSMDLERKLRELINMLINGRAQNDQVADHLKKIIMVTDSYDGYTTGPEDKTFMSGMNVRCKKLQEELKSSNAGMKKSVDDLEKVILVFRADKKTGDPAKDQLLADKRKGELMVFEQMVQKHLDGQKRILETSLGNKQQMSDYILEEKVQRRRNECDDIENEAQNYIQQIMNLRQQVDEELAKLQEDPDMADHIGQIRVSLQSGDGYFDQIETFRQRNQGIAFECDSLWERIQEANAHEMRWDMRLDLWNVHLLLKQKIKGFRGEFGGFWIIVYKWITMMMSMISTRPTKTVVVTQPVVQKPAFKVTPGDDLDKMLAEIIMRLNCTVPISRLGGGYYMFGSKKIFCKIINGKLVVRVGGGYMGIEEFIQTYMKQETDKAGLAEKLTQQVIAKGNSNFSAAAVSNQSKKTLVKK